VATVVIEAVARRTSGFVPNARNLASIMIVPAARTQKLLPPLTTLAAHIGELVVSMVPEYVWVPIGGVAKQIEIGVVP
jgi:hypothetical protein